MVRWGEVEGSHFEAAMRDRSDREKSAGRALVHALETGDKTTTRRGQRCGPGPEEFPSRPRSRPRLLRRRPMQMLGPQAGVSRPQTRNPTPLPFCLIILKPVVYIRQLNDESPAPPAIGLTLLACGLCGKLGKEVNRVKVRSKVPVGERKVVKTTAYTDSESGHRSYGVKNAIGSRLQSGSMNSAAADWSRFPIGTKFRIVDNNQLYVIDDYGARFGWHRYHRFVRAIAPTYESMGRETRNDRGA